MQSTHETKNSATGNKSKKRKSIQNADGSAEAIEPKTAKSTEKADEPASKRAKTEATSTANAEERNGKDEKLDISSPQPMGQPLSISIDSDSEETKKHSSPVLVPSPAKTSAEDDYVQALESAIAELENLKTADKSQIALAVDKISKILQFIDMRSEAINKQTTQLSAQAQFVETPPSSRTPARSQPPKKKSPSPLKLTPRDVSPLPLLSPSVANTGEIVMPEASLGSAISQQTQDTAAMSRPLRKRTFASMSKAEATPTSEQKSAVSPEKDLSVAAKPKKQRQRKKDGSLARMKKTTKKSPTVMATPSVLESAASNAQASNPDRGIADTLTVLAITPPSVPSQTQAMTTPVSMRFSPAMHPVSALALPVIPSYHQLHAQTPAAHSGSRFNFPAMPVTPALTATPPHNHSRPQVVPTPSNPSLRLPTPPAALPHSHSSANILSKLRKELSPAMQPMNAASASSVSSAPSRSPNVTPLNLSLINSPQSLSPFAAPGLLGSLGFLRIAQTPTPRALTFPSPSIAKKGPDKPA